MKTPALVISKDLVKELKRLAVAAIEDENTFNKARDHYLAAGDRFSSSASEFAVNLFAFAEQFADQPALVDAQLNQFGINYQGSSVYHSIVRLAVDDVKIKTDEALRMHISRYARLIQSAHAKGMTASEFKKEVDKGITTTMKALGVIPVDKPQAIALEREEASRNLSNMTFPLKGIAPPDGTNDGDELELVARYENGQVVVFGMIPPSVSGPKAALTKLGSTLLAPKKQPLELLSHLQRALKLVTNGKDASLFASYAVADGEVQFTVVAEGAVAALSAPLEFDFLSGKSTTLPVATWGAICTTLMPIANKVQTVTWDKRSLLVTVDEGEIPHLARWFEDKGRPITIGDAVDASIRFDMKTTKEPATTVVDSSAWRDSRPLDEAALKPLTDHKPTKTITAFRLASGKLSVKDADESVDGHVNLKRKQLSALKEVIKKLLRLASGAVAEVTLEQADGYLRVSAPAENGVAYSVVFEVA